MKYRVRLSARAECDVDEVLAWFHEQSAAPATRRWFSDLWIRLATLESHPTRCAMSPEAEEIGIPIRELHLGRRSATYRLIFQIEGQTVFILRVWHSARAAITKADV